MRTLTRILLFCLLLPAGCTTDIGRLECRIDRIAERCDARIGVAVTTPAGLLLSRNDTLLPMLSVFKFPVALAALDRMERDTLPLTHPVTVGFERLDRNTYSPMRDSLPAGGGTVALGALLRYAVSASDNIACDLLIDFAGGPAVVDDYVRSLGIDGMRILTDERRMHLTVGNQRLNAARPSAVCALFDRFLRGGVLSAAHEAFLRSLLVSTETGADKLKAGLPARTVIGHKTGSSDRTADGIRIADNDAGYVLLPDGRSYCIAVFVTDSEEDDAANAAVIAAISAAVYDHFADDPNSGMHGSTPRPDRYTDRTPAH